MRRIPATATTREVVAVVKGAMWEAADLLVQQERLARLQAQDSDLDSESDDDLGLSDSGRFGGGGDGRGAAGFDVERDSNNEAGGGGAAENEEDNGQQEEEMPPSYAAAAENMSGGIAAAAAVSVRRTTGANEGAAGETGGGGGAHWFAASGAGAKAGALDRMEILFREFIGLQNNGARWLGRNSKLTRLKLEGGMATILRLEMAWEQFDRLWSAIDTSHDGTIGADEFRRAFGDVGDLGAFGGTAAAAVSAADEAAALRAAIGDVSETLRQLGLSLREVFCSFDRNGSGRVSVAEFTSLMKMLLGRQLTKHQVFLLMNCMDESGDREIEFVELMTFFFRVWMDQLAALSAAAAAAAERPADADVRRRRRRALKQALRDNFSRKFRDAARERGRELQGPFTALLHRMGLGAAAATATAGA
ncbi:unnamed protein product, partial [Phaeothamnion confervicola]